MKKYLNIALSYAIAAMAGGVLYRELTKWYAYTGDTALGKLHPHLLLLGTGVYLFIALFSSHSDLKQFKLFRVFSRVYAVGLPLTALMLLIRGLTQVLALPLSKGLSSAISGVAGIGHILVGTGLVLLLLSFKKLAKD